MIIVPYRAEHLARINPEPEQAGAMRPFVSPAVAASLEGPYAWTAAEGSLVLGCAGFAPKWLDHWTAWAFFGAEAGPHMLAITRAALAMRDRWPYGRIEAATPCDFRAGAQWLHFLGFRLEAERMRRYAPDGSDHALYSFIHEAPKP